ncbi:MAG: porin [Pseudomonadota bacterium]|nr:porin [Pseudomonadota bacterium]
MKLKKTILIGTVLLAIGLPVNASSEIETLIGMLHENGMISEAQYGRLQAELNQRQEQNNQEKSALQNQLAQATRPSDVEVSVKGGVTVKTRDGAFTTKLGARVMADAAAYGNDNNTMGDGTKIRRARMSVEGKMYHDWGYKFEYDFATDHNKGIADAFVEYRGLDAMSFRVGNMKDPFSLQFQMNANYNLFMERSLTNGLNSGRHIGAMAFTNRKNWTASAGLFGEAVQTVGGANDEGWGLGSRISYAPINNKGSLLHLAVSANYRDAGEAAILRFKQQPESDVSGINIVDTGNMTDVDSHSKYGFEVAMVSGPLSVQSEYVTTSVSRNSTQSLDFDSWYIQTGYFFTGESRQYANGKFGKITPRASVGEGGIGAWEFGLRYSTINLNDQDILGGKADSFTYGVNWFATNTIRFSANYMNVLDVNGGPLDSIHPDIVQLRSQWAF